MSDRMTYGIPASAGFDLQDLETVIAASRPTKSHDALRRALAARWPTIPWRVAAPSDEFTMEGGIVDQTLTRVADKASSWIRQRVVEADGDYLLVWRQFKGDPSLLRTAFRGGTVWVFAPLGEGAADYVQLAVDQLQEVVLGPLIDGADWRRRPESIDDLCDEWDVASIDSKPLGGLRYRLRRAVHADGFLAELAAVERQRRMEFLAGNILHEQRRGAGRPGTIAVTATHRVRRGTPVTPGYREVEITEQDPEYLSRKMPIERFYADWSASSAGRLANHLFDHWAVRFSDHEDDRGRHLHGIPVWLTRKTLPKIETKSGQTVFALMDQLQRLDGRVGCTFGWYFFMLHGNRIGPSVGEQVTEAVEDGMITLPRWDRDNTQAMEGRALFVLMPRGAHCSR